MTDVFVKCWAETELRTYLALAVIRRIQMMPDARLVTLTHETFSTGLWEGCEDDEVFRSDRFWIATKQYADENARSPIYVVLDDDHLPIGKDWLARGVAALEARPDFGMLASWSINGEVGVPLHPYQDEDVFEHFACGTPYFCRAGSLGDLPDGPLESYDQVLSEHVKKIGRIGFLKNVRHNHLGCGYSQVIPGHWGA